jgi:hypothetical protein
MAHDNKSFYKLIDVMISMQNCMESSFMVNSWLLGAFKDGLDVNALLDSQILSTVCDVAILEHFDKWPHFHKVLDQMTENYNKSFMELMHDEEAYQQLFGHKFTNVEKEVEHLLKKNLFETAKDEKRNDLFPIKYFAERLPVGAKSSEEQLEIVF